MVVFYTLAQNEFMAQSTKASPFAYLFLVLLFLLPLVQVASLQDKALLSRFLVLNIASIAMLFMLWKDLKQLKLSLFSTALISILFLALLISGFNALNSSEVFGSLARYASFLPLVILLESALRLKRINSEDVLKAAFLFGAVAAIPALFQLLKSLGSGAFFDDIYIIKGTFTHKNLLASAMMLSFPFVLAAWASLKGWWSKAAMILAILMVLELFVLRTRGVWLGLIGASAISVISFKLLKVEALAISKKWSLILGGLATLILVGLFLSPQIKAGFTNSSNVQKRLVFWSNTIEMVKEHPLTGVGAGNWRLIFPKYGLSEVDESTRQGITHIQRPHNDFLWLWAEAGPIALLALLALYFLAFKQVFRNLKQEEGLSLYLQAAALFSLIAFGIFSFSDFPMERAPHTFFFALALALILSPSQARLRAQIPIYAAGAALVFALFVNFQRFKAEQGMEAVLQANASQNANGIVTAAEAVYSDWYTVDNYANPINYYSGKGYLFTNRPQQAFEALQTAMIDAPYNILVYESMAQYYARQGDLDQAIDYAAQGLSISPQFKMLILLKAEIHIQRKEFADALAALNMHEPRSNDQRYQQDLATALRGALRTYDEHGRFTAMMEHLKNSGPLERPEDYIRAYRQKRGV